MSHKHIPCPNKIYHVPKAVFIWSFKINSLQVSGIWSIRLSSLFSKIIFEFFLMDLGSIVEVIFKPRTFKNQAPAKARARSFKISAFEMKIHSWIHFGATMLPLSYPKSIQMASKLDLGWHRYFVCFLGIPQKRGDVAFLWKSHTSKIHRSFISTFTVVFACSSRSHFTKFLLPDLGFEFSINFIEKLGKRNKSFFFVEVVNNYRIQDLFLVTWKVCFI